MIFTITLEDGRIIEMDNFELLAQVKNSEGLLKKMSSDEYFTVTDIYGESLTEKWSMIKSIQFNI